MYVQFVHSALGNKGERVQLVYEGTCCLAWRFIFDKRRHKCVVCVFSIFSKNPIAAKETIVDGGDKKYGNSHFSEQNRQNSISRFNSCRLHRIAREARGALTVWRHEQMVISTIQAAQEHHSIWMPLYDSMHAA